MKKGKANARPVDRPAEPGLNYLLRNIPGELWQEVKHRAVDDKTTAREIILEALREYLNK